VQHQALAFTSEPSDADVYLATQKQPTSHLTQACNGNWQSDPSTTHQLRAMMVQVLCPFMTRISVRIDFYELETLCTTAPTSSGQASRGMASSGQLYAVKSS
jgi:hypothetical protein